MSEKREITDETYIFPLSFAQERMWFLHKFDPDSPFYTVPALTCRLSGALNMQALEQSLGEIIRRHETLRTTFHEIDGEPSQIIHPHWNLSITVTDLREMPAQEREEQARQIAIEEMQKPFNLYTGPLIRAKLLRLEPEEHVLILPIHHIISDGWSLGIILRELVSLYEAFSAGNESPLPDLPIQYVDYTVWQKEWLQGKHLERQLSYWKKQLANLSLLEFPTDHHRPSTLTFHGKRYSFQIDKALTDQLKGLSRQEGVTLFMTLLMAFKILLFRYTAQEDIVVGSPIANRNQAELENLVGFFVNTIVLRSALSDDLATRELIAKVREVCLEAYDHQDLPFEKLVEELQPERNRSRNPLFQVAFALQNAPIPALELEGLTLTPLDVHTNTAKFDLTLDLWEHPEGLWGRLEYNTELFEAATIARMAGHFQTLLRGIVTNPDHCISELPLLTAGEKHQLLVEWNNTSVESPQHRCIHHLFESQVKQTPHAVAVVFNDQQLTYEELNIQANQLAHYLRKVGVGTETLVGILMKRSLRMVVGILGILKAGGAYIPLDTNYPKERLIFMLEDSRMEFLLTQEELTELIPKPKPQVICLDTDWQTIAQSGTANPSNVSKSNDLVYLIYTSGSTGKPKGVKIRHSSLVNLVLWHKRVFGVTPADRVSNIAGLSFDASVWELWSNLIVGASIFLFDDSFGMTPANILNWLVKKAITVCFLPTPLAELFIQQDLPRDLALRILFTGGDKLHRNPTKDLPFSFFNLYGPTENTIITTWAQVGKGAGNNTSPLIGRPISNVQVYILDSNLNPVPIGVTGELFIGGDGLAKGYLYRPDLTNERFVPNPFTPDKDGRMYKTGDLARYHSDGNIEFLGRNDYQVKVRGYRIELGEIETVLTQNHAVREVVVQASGNANGDKRLVAYLVPNTQYLNSWKQATGLQHEQVSRWQKLYDATYSQPPLQKDPAFNITGWNSSYTGKPIPEDEMYEWVKYTVERILSVQPKHVYEIGCGMGLLLFRIASNCESYLGSDFSQVALDYVYKQLATLDDGHSAVSLQQRQADDFEDIPRKSFDTVIINSVVQYFPDIEYLMRVLEGAVMLVKDGGVIFIGDVRSLPLMEAFHTSVQLHNASSSLQMGELKQQISVHMKHEEELVVDPIFFYVFKNHFPRVNRVEILQKRGRYDNELTKYRFDVFLHIGPEENPSEGFVSLDWHKDELSISKVRQTLAVMIPNILVVQRVPNLRIFTDIKTTEWLASADPDETVAELQEFLENYKDQGIHPMDFWVLEESLPYTVDIYWAGEDEEGFCDVVFRRRSPEIETRRGNPISHEEKMLQTPWKEYANNLLDGMLLLNLVPNLRNFLQEKLPEYMIPSEYVMLDKLPLTPNGKVDRNALPALDTTRIDSKQGYVAPRNPTEQAIVEIWTKVLNIQQIGIQDNFFDLGGHSLLVLQVLALSKKAFGIDIPLSRFFENPTIFSMASTIEDNQKIVSQESKSSFHSVAERMERVENSMPIQPPELVAIKPRGDKPPLFFIHPAGGVVFPYYDLAYLLPPDQPFWGIQDTSMSGESEPLGSIEAYAERYLSSIRWLQPEGPYFLAGWSFGGLVAYEIACRLDGENQKTAFLGLLDTKAPLHRTRTSLHARISMNLYLLRSYVWGVGEALGYLRDAYFLIGRQLQQQVDEESEKLSFFERLQLLQVDALRQTFLKQTKVENLLAENTSLTEISLPGTSISRVLNLVRAHQRIAVRYTPKPYPGRVTLFKGESKSKRSAQISSKDPTLGWRNLAGKGVDIRPMPVNHILLLRRPFVTQLAAELQLCLDSGLHHD